MEECGKEAQSHDIAIQAEGTEEHAISSGWFLPRVRSGSNDSESCHAAYSTVPLSPHTRLGTARLRGPTDLWIRASLGYLRQFVRSEASGLEVPNPSPQ